MLKIPRQQVLERWDTLPDNLKEALFSESNSGIVWQIGTLNHLPEEKISMMATIVGDVIFGFLHPDDLTREIQESLNLNYQIANSISHEINRKIFEPIRIALEKVYSPVSAMPFGAAQSKQEIKTPVESEIKPEPRAGEAEKTEASSAKPKLFGEIQDKPAEIKQGIEPKPAPLPTAPTIPTIPTIPVIPAPPIPTAPVSVKKSFDENPDKPFMIHQEAEPRPIAEKRNTTMPTINWFKKEKPRQMPEMPTKIELETFNQKPEEKKEPVTAKTEAPKQRIVHYREAEISTPFGKTETPPRRIETPIPAAIKTEAPKPKEPKAVSFDSFEVIKGKENEVGLEGNTINLKNNKQLQ